MGAVLRMATNSQDEWALNEWIKWVSEWASERDRKGKRIGDRGRNEKEKNKCKRQQNTLSVCVVNACRWMRNGKNPIETLNESHAFRTSYVCDSCSPSLCLARSLILCLKCCYWKVVAAVVCWVFALVARFFLLLSAVYLTGVLQCAIA